jgi:hypothetical protein
MLEFCCGIFVALVLSASVAIYSNFREQMYLAYIHGSLAGIAAGACIDMVKHHPKSVDDDIETGLLKGVETSSQLHSNPPPFKQYRKNVMLEFMTLLNTVKGKIH